VDFCAGMGSKQTRHWPGREGVEKGRQSSQEVEFVGRLAGGGVHKGDHKARECPCAVAEESRLPPVAVNCSALPQNLLGQDRGGSLCACAEELYL